MIGLGFKREGRNALRATAAAALLSLLAACASTPQQQAQLDPRNGDGLGGTGMKQGVQTAAVNRRGDGLGGTGIIGTISGFGSNKSICDGAPLWNK